VARSKDEVALTHKQLRFVAFYLGESKRNATDAARRAGYAWPEKQGLQQLAKTSIRAAIDAAVAGSAMSAEEVLARLSEQATVDMADFLAITRKEVKLDLWKAKQLGKTHLIKKLKPTRYGMSIELCDPRAALDLLGRHHGLWDRDDDKSKGDDAPPPGIKVPKRDDRFDDGGGERPQG
jgi:hypothetical protein